MYAVPQETPDWHAMKPFLFIFLAFVVGLVIAGMLTL